MRITNGSRTPHCLRLPLLELSKITSLPLFFSRSCPFTIAGQILISDLIEYWPDINIQLNFIWVGQWYWIRRKYNGKEERVRGLKFEKENEHIE